MGRVWCDDENACHNNVHMVKANGKWQQFTHKFVPQKDYANVRVHIGANFLSTTSNGVLYIDDVELYVQYTAIIIIPDSES